MSAPELIGVPFDGGSALSGPREAFGALHAHLRRARPEVLERFSRVRDLDEDRWGFLDRERLSRSARAVAESAALPICVGGCHSVTYYLASELRRRLGDLALVVFDAHSDASAARGEFVSHGNWVRSLSRTGPLRLFCVGLRGDEGKLHDLDAEVLPARHFRPGEGLAWLKGFEEELRRRPLYVSIDVDCLDPAFCPGVNFPIAGGLEPRELLDMVRWLSSLGLAGADLVEYAPRLDAEGRALPVLAELVDSLGGAAHRTSPKAQPQAPAPLETALAEAVADTSYQVPAAELRQRHRLQAPARGPWLRYAAERSRCLFGVGAEGVFARAAVIGGPCLYHTDGDPQRLTLRELLDLVSPLALAAFLELPCLLYLDTDQELRLAGAPDEAGRAAAERRFAPLVAGVRAFAGRLARDLGLSMADVSFAETARRPVSACLDRWALLAPRVEDEALTGLYSLDDTSRFPEGDAREASYRAVFRRTLLTYQPPVVAELCGRPVDQVLAAENLDQAKSVRAAADLQQRWLGAATIHHVAHLSAPDTHGKSMLKGRGKDRLHVLDEGLFERLRHLKEPMRGFYATAFPSVWGEPALESLVLELRRCLRGTWP